MDKEKLIEELQLKPHVEGGYFTRTYTSQKTTTISSAAGEDVSRGTMSSIFYLMTTDSPINYFNKNTSDIMHYFHLGLPIRYHVVNPEGHCTSTILGPDLLAGHKLQLMVPEGYLKAAELIVPDGESPLNYGLISEAVSPEFHYDDWCMCTVGDIQKLLPQNWQSYRRFIKQYE